MRHRSNYDRMLFLTSPMAFVRARTHDLVFTRQPLDHGCSLTLIFIIEVNTMFLQLQHEHTYTHTKTHACTSNIFLTIIHVYEPDQKSC